VLVAAVALPDTGKSYPMAAIVAAGYGAVALGYAWAVPHRGIVHIAGQ
jgi:hypothetical protein